MPNPYNNPFRQSPAYWQVIFTVPLPCVAMIEESFGDLAVACSSFEIEEGQPRDLVEASDWSVFTPGSDGPWRVELLFEERPDEAEIKRRIAIVEAVVNGAQAPLGLRPSMGLVVADAPPGEQLMAPYIIPFPAIQRIEAKDWVSEVQKNFPPLSIGRYYVHGSHVEEPPPVGSIVLQVDAGAAFGSGEHATTSGCLLAMDRLARARDFTNILDMGCGSGILALAAAKTWRGRVTAVDIDEVAVKVARRNAKINQLGRFVRAYAGDGYRLREVRGRGPYDLIIANILARPLIKFAPALARNLAPGGVAVLSGLLNRQERMVLAAHETQGLRLQARIRREGWSALVIGRD